jgi:hypothetical protein
MSPRNSSIRALAPEDTSSSTREVSETPSDRRAREKAALELARLEAMADPSMRKLLAALAKR